MNRTPAGMNPWLVRASVTMQLVPVVGEIEPEAGRGDDVDRQIAERDRGRPAQALEARAHEMQRVLRRIEQHRPAPDGGEATQTRRPARHRDEQVEGQEAFPALRLAADHADRLIGPQIGRSATAAPADRRATRRHGRWAASSPGAAGPRTRSLGGRRREEIEEELLVELRPLALGAREEQFVRVRHQRPVIAAGVIDQRVEQAGRQQAGIAGLLQDVRPQWRRHPLHASGARFVREHTFEHPSERDAMLLRVLDRSTLEAIGREKHALVRTGRPLLVYKRTCKFSRSTEVARDLLHSTGTRNSTSSAVKRTAGRVWETAL